MLTFLKIYQLVELNLLAFWAQLHIKWKTERCSLWLCSALPMLFGGTNFFNKTSVARKCKFLRISAF